MTQDDADTLQVWITRLTLKQLALLWRWITLYYMKRCSKLLTRRVKP